MKKFSYILLLLVFMASAVYGGCDAKCGTIVTPSCNYAATFPFDGQKVEVSDVMKYSVKTKCCADGSNFCCQKDYIKITGLTPGKYNLKVSVFSDQDIMNLKIATSCAILDNSPDIYSGMINNLYTATITLSSPELYILAQAIANEGKTYYTIILEKIPDIVYSNLGLCNLFKSGINAKSVDMEGEKLYQCNATKIYTDTVISNDLLCSNQCENFSACTTKPTPSFYDVKFYTSTKSTPVPANYLFDQNNYQDASFNLSQDSTITFKATTTYPNAQVSYMLLGAFVLSSQNNVVTMRFDPGDYFFEKLDITDTHLKIIPTSTSAPVRIFVKGDVTLSNALLESTTALADNIQIFIGEKLSYQLPDTCATFDIGCLLGSLLGEPTCDSNVTFSGYIYANDIDIEGECINLIGAIAAKNSLKIEGDNIHIQYKSPNNCPKSYCEELELSEGFHIVDPDGGDRANAFEIYCDMSSQYAPRDLLALPLKNEYNNLVFTKEQLESTDYYSEALSDSIGFQAIHIYAKTLEVIVDPDQKEPISSNGYSVMGSTFSNINLIGTPLAIDWSQTAISGCNESKLRKAYYGQAVKINTLDYDNAICTIDHMKLKILDDYTYLTDPGGNEILEISCKELSEQVPQNVLPSDKIKGHYWITPYNSQRDEHNSIQEASKRPFVVYCWFQPDLNWAWTFLLALDGKRTKTKDDLLQKKDTCSAMGLFPFVPYKEESFERVRKFLLANKDEWSNYTGTIQEKVKALTGLNYYLDYERDSLIWPYGSFGVYFDKTTDHTNWKGADSHTPGWMSGAPMHNIKSITTDYPHKALDQNRKYYEWSSQNYPSLPADKLRYSSTDIGGGDGRYRYEDTMGAKGWKSILKDFNISEEDEWFISRSGAGINFDQRSAAPYDWPYFEPNGNYDNGCWLNYLYDDEGYVRHNDDWDCKYPYYDYMCMARDNYTQVTRYSLIKGPYELIDRDIPQGQEIDNLYIRTQIIKKPIQLDLVLLDENRTHLLDQEELSKLTLSAGIFLVKTYYNKGSERVQEVRYLGELNGYKPTQARINFDTIIGEDFQVDSANRRMFVKFKFCTRDDYNWSDCWESGVGGKCKASQEYYCAQADSNDFAVRPKRFAFVGSPLQKIIAGEETELLFGALDAGNGYSIDYNETQGGSFDINVSLADDHKQCMTKKLTVQNVAFEDGFSNSTLTFDDVGEFNLTMYEIVGSEFAAIDRNDTNDSRRLIEPFTHTISIVPHHFDLNSTIIAQNPQGFTYIANEIDQIASILEVNITAKNKQNAITKNYTKACFAHDVEFNASYDITPLSPDLDTLLVQNVGSTTIKEFPISAKLLSTTFDRAIFDTDQNGTGIGRVRLNFKRYVHKPITPFTLQIKETNATDANGVQGTAQANKSTDYYYARVYSSNEFSNVIKGNEGNVTIYYELYAPITPATIFTIFPNPLNAAITTFLQLLPTDVDDLNWRINEYHTTTDGNISQILFKDVDILTSPSSPLSRATLSPLFKGSHQLRLKYNGSSAPYIATLEINASKWLIYDKSDPNAQTNTFKVKFLYPGIWLGVGEQFSIQNESNISNIDKKRIQW
ncbi:MAG: hypothetical protein C6H99_00375 [Epsilonproteobacteria bacterium]|nr:hypothetical protein [Campylobacterota bacterium]NPA63813.1 hypothetical protein [Campylobacterota bacterium]